MRAPRLILPAVALLGAAACTDEPNAPPRVAVPVDLPGPAFEGSPASGGMPADFRSLLASSGDYVVYGTISHGLVRWNPRTGASLPLPGGDGAEYVNEAGQVVGNAGNHAARWNAAGAVDTLQTPTGFDSCWPTAMIFPNSVVFGTCYREADDHSIPVRWNGRRVTLLTIPDFVWFNHAVLPNILTYDVRVSSGASVTRFMRTDGTILHDVPGLLYNVMADMQAVTTVNTPGIGYQPIYVSPTGGRTMLPLQAGGQTGRAEDMIADGTIVGQTTGPLGTQASMWTFNGTTHTLVTVGAGFFTNIDESGWARGRIDGRPVLYHPERGKVFIDQDPTVQGIVLTTLSRNQTIAVVSGPGRGVRYYPTPNPQAVLPDTAMLDASNAITVRPTFAAATNGPFTWRITWGDGTVAETGTVTTPAGMPVLTHTYAGSAAGRRVYLRVTDGTGRTGYDTLTVVAKPLGAITTNGPWTAGEGVRVPLTASVADADGETLTFTWSLGNGQTVRGASITARYADNGAYPITLTVSSARGVSRTWTGTATITNTIPVATLVAPDSVDPGALILVILTNARDNGTADMAAGFRYAFDCGGGTLADAANVPTAVCGPAPMTGRVTLRAAIRDKDGGERILTKRVYVRPAPAPGG